MNIELEGVVTITSKEELHQDEVGQNMDEGRSMARVKDCLDILICLPLTQCNWT
jgi:hypothetical protein